MNSVGLFTAFWPKRTSFFGQMWLQLYPVLQQFYSISHSLFRQTKLTSDFLQYILLGISITYSEISYLVKIKVGNCFIYAM